MYYNNFSNQPIRVCGEAEARAHQMMPNSTALLLDANEPILWVAQTDGMGYKQVTPYRLEKMEIAKKPTIETIIERLNKMEERLNESNSRRPFTNTDTAEFSRPLPKNDE